MAKLNKKSVLGKTFGYLTIISILDVKSKKDVTATCRCGKTKDFILHNIIRGYTKSCGCKRKDYMTQKATSHGLSKHQLYAVRISMINRCYNSNYKWFKDYGGRGVRVCDEWRDDFLCFYNWALSNGWKKGMQLDKDIIPSKLGIPALLYSPEMCCFVSQKENLNYKRNNVKEEYNGEVKNVSQWAEIFNMSHVRISNGIKNNGSLEKYLTKTRHIKQ